VNHQNSFASALDKATDQSSDTQAAAPVTEHSAEPAQIKPVPPGGAVPVFLSQASELAKNVACIEVDVVMKGCLQRIKLKAGTDPARVADLIKAADPNAKLRDDFPRSKQYSRETKTARALSIIVKVTDSSKFIDVICSSGDDDFTIGVPRKKADSFPDDLAALGKLSERNMDKIRGAFESKGSATVVLGAEEFGVVYWTTDDGKHFLDSMAADPPADQPEKPKPEGEHE